MKSLLLTLSLLSFSAFALDQDMEGATITPTRPTEVNVTFDESTFESQPWIKEFHYVVVVNKGNQTIKVFEHGQTIITGKVSTGRDQFEEKGEHGSKMAAWTITPTGYYTPTYLDKNHKSTAYRRKWGWLKGGIKMPYSIFFNEGIALHQTPAGTEAMLGQKASGGCIRLPELIASDLFYRVLETMGEKNPLFNVDGTAKYDSEGHLRYSTTPGFSALIVVINRPE